MRVLKKLFVFILKQTDLGSALAVRLTKLTGKSKVPIHPKHLLTEKPWFIKYIKKNDVVLDLGCGNGQNSIKAAKIAKKVVGVEIDGNLIDIAKTSASNKKLKNIKFIKGDLEKELKFPQLSFNKVIFLDVLEHLNNRDNVLKEASRVLKNGCLLLLGVPNSETSWKKLQRSAGICSFSDPDHKIEFSERSIKGLLKKHKLKLINFAYGKYDMPARGVVDIVGALSLTIYKNITNWRYQKAQSFPNEASGFEIVAKKL